MTEKSISILGCGWLGFPLAKSFIKSGFRVNGSTTTPSRLAILSEAGIQPFLIDLSNNPEAGILKEFVQGSEVLIIAIPPKIRSGEGAAYPTMLKNFLIRLPEKNRPEKVIFISSTAVYPDLNKEVTETDTPVNAEENYLLQAEAIVKDHFQEHLTVIRFCGLMGPGREPGRFLAGKTNVANADAPVNMIHLDDCIGIITQIINQDRFGETFNACSDFHPARKVFFTRAALNKGLLPPVFSDEPVSGFKQISSKKLKQQLSYTFIHPDPLALV